MPARDDAVERDVHDSTLVTLGDLESGSLYDSLLRKVAGASTPAAPAEPEGLSSIAINAEVGPNGKFVLQQEIGSGAMGRVYRALDRYLLRDVALKFILRPDGMSHDDFMALFWQEAHIIARLDQHDNIVRILDVDRSSYPPFIVMEYLDGQSLEHRMRRGPLPLAAVLHVMIGVACGLGEAHAKGVFHRDLKPSNIFLQKTGRVKLLDFGLARIRDHLFELSTTKAGFVKVHAVPPLASAGTPAYMAPEQWRGEDADVATDLWAMGAILYRLLAQAPPFDAPSLSALSGLVMSGARPAPLGPQCPDVPPELCELVDHLLRFDRTARPRGVAQVIAALEAVLRKTSSDAPRGPVALSAPQLGAPAPSSDPWSVGSREGSDPGARIAHGTHPLDELRRWDRMLIVLVAGETSHDRIAPDQLPGWICRAAGVACEVVTCPPVIAGDDVEDAAIRLRGFLNARIKRPRHLFFVAHGDGASVVLRMLLDELHRLWPAGGAPELDVHSPFYCARHVAILRPGRGVATAHHVASLNPDPATAPLVAELVGQTQRFADATLPAPAIHYHGTGDEPAINAGSPAVRSLAAVIARPELTFASETIAQSFELDCANKITTLVAPADDSHDAHEAASVAGALAASQAEVFEELLGFARTQHQRPHAMVIAGDAGVGKSTILRMAARRLCSELISDAGAVLPIVFPLYFASLSAEQLGVLEREASKDRRGRVFHDVLLDWWCDWFNDITYGDAANQAWIKERLRCEPVMLIFDGVDEFITNHPGLRIADFQQMFAFLGTEYRQNGWLTIACGVRSTQPGLSLLASSNIREVLRLTPAQALRQFPAAASWLPTEGDLSTRKLLLTPLILAQLNTRRTAKLRPATHGDVILLALTTIIEQSDLCGKLDHRGQPIDAQRWIDALMAAAWCMFRQLRGEIATTALRAEASELHRSWQAHLERTEQEIEGEHLLSGFHLLLERRAFDALVQRTILYSTGRGEVRFSHREWQDFLAANYLAQVVVYRHVDEFRHIGNTARISQMAGEILCQRGLCIDEALVVALLRHAQETGAPLITANFSALLTNSRVLLEGPAIDVFLSAVNAAPLIARHITLIGLGYRAMRDDDASAPDLRYRLARVFRDYLTAAEPPPELGLMRSLAWCYQKAYARRFGGPPVREPWPGLDAASERAVLAMMCSTSDDGPRFLAEHRSVQMALLEVQQVVAADPNRPISGIHYLYCLCVARHHGGGIAELGRELPALLAPGSPYATAIERYDLVPELRDILALCRQLAAG